MKDDEYGPGNVVSWRDAVKADPALSVSLSGCGSNSSGNPVVGANDEFPCGLVPGSLVDTDPRFLAAEDFLLESVVLLPLFFGLWLWLEPDKAMEMSPIAVLDPCGCGDMVMFPDKDSKEPLFPTSLSMLVQ